MSQLKCNTWTKMQALKGIVIIAIMLGVTSPGHLSVLTATNIIFIRENITIPKISEHKTISFLHSRKVPAIKKQREFLYPSMYFTSENKAMNAWKTTIPEEKSKLKHFPRSSHSIKILRVNQAFSSPKIRSSDLERTENNSTGSPNNVETRIRRDTNNEIRDPFHERPGNRENVLDGSGQNENNDDEEEDDDDEDDGDDLNHDAKNNNDNSTQKVPNNVGHGTNGFNISETASLVRKCCKVGASYTRGRTSCTRNITLHKNFQPRSVNGILLSYIDHSPCIYGGYRLESQIHNNEKYLLLDSGFLIFQNKILGLEEFCLEAFLDIGEKILPVVCYTSESYHSQAYTHIIVGKAITFLFLLIVLIIYILIPELRNTFGVGVLCHITTLLFAYIIFIIVEQVYPHMSLSSCTNYALVIFFLFESSFFWLNVMCYDLCWTLCKLKTLEKKLKLILYSCYAWGMPLILLIICVCRDLVPGIPEFHLKPEYGKGGCLYSIQMEHFYPPVIVLQVSNVILFAGTFFIIFCYKKEIALAENGKDNTYKNKQLYNMSILYFKLFMIKGIVVVTMIILWSLDARIILWYLINLQEIFICISLAFNENILNLINKRRHYWSHHHSCSYRWKPKDISGKYRQTVKPNSSTVENNPVDLELKTIKSNTESNNT